jgi:hypothetical protein
VSPTLLLSDEATAFFWLQGPRGITRLKVLCYYAHVSLEQQFMPLMRFHGGRIAPGAAGAEEI